MYNQLRNEHIIVELETLVKNSENFDELTTDYIEFMKERILSVSGVN